MEKMMSNYENSEQFSNDFQNVDNDSQEYNNSANDNDYCDNEEDYADSQDDCGDSQNDNYHDDNDGDNNDNDGQNDTENDDNDNSQSGIGSSDEPKYVRLRGLPWSATNREIIDFLKNVNVVGGVNGIHLVTSRWDGKNTGEAYVEVETDQDVHNALKLDNTNLGHRYIEVFTAQAKEARGIVGKTASSSMSYVVKLRGLPYSVTEQQIEEFFNGLEIKPDREGISFVTDKRGRATGEAFVQFVTQEDTEQALGRNREKIGHRYIEIFRSSIAEMKRSTNTSSVGRVAPYNVRERGSNRASSVTSDYSSNRSGRGWSNNNSSNNNNKNGGFGVGANNTLGFNNLPFSNNGNFNSFGNFGSGSGLGRGNFGRNNVPGNFGNNNCGVGMGGFNRFGGNSGNFGNDFGDFGNFGNNRNNPIGNNFGGFGNFGNFGNGPAGFGGLGNFAPIGGRVNDVEYFAVHMRGLPYTSFENDIFKFFDPIRPANVRINYNEKNRHSGTADVYFDTYNDAQDAMKRHREKIGSRYIELFFDGKVKGDDMYNDNGYGVCGGGTGNSRRGGGNSGSRNNFSRLSSLYWRIV